MTSPSSCLYNTILQFLIDWFINILGKIQNGVTNHIKFGENGFNLFKLFNVKAVSMVPNLRKSAPTANKFTEIGVRRPA